MSLPRDPDRIILAWLDDDLHVREPAHLLGQVLATTQRTRRRPGWAIPERWLPMSYSLRLAGRTGAVVSFAVLLILLAAMAAAVVVASQVSPAPSPFGPARNGLIAYDAFGDIWTMNPDGTGRKQLTSGPAIDLAPLWSPDGTRIAYVSWPNTTPVDPSGDNFTSLLRTWIGGPGTLTVMNGDGSGPMAIGPAVGTGASTWVPGDRGVAFADGGRWFIDALDGTEEVELVIPDLSPDSGPTWSPDGTRIAYQVGSTGEGSVGIWIAEADGDDAHRISEPVPAGQVATQPTWSPDGGSVAFFVGRSGGGAFDVHIARLDGSGEIAVTTGGPDEYSPTWSPDGSRLVFDRVIVPSNNLVQLVVAAPDGSDQVTLDSEALFGTLPVWAPDGTAIAMQKPADPTADFAWGWVSDIVILDPTGTAAPRMIPARGAFANHSWQRLEP